MNRIKQEPVIVGAIVALVTALAAGWGFQLDGETTATIAAVVTALVGLITRRMVTPVPPATPTPLEPLGRP